MVVVAPDRSATTNRCYPEASTCRGPVRCRRRPGRPEARACRISTWRGVTRTVVPQSRDGTTHPRYPGRRSAGAHSAYSMNGAAVSMAAHVDYLVRSDALGMCDLIDAEAERQEENATAIYTNIQGGRERVRSLFEAAEDHERVPARELPRCLVEKC